MKCGPTLTVMLTYNDMTVCNAHEIFEKCKNSSAEYWGFESHKTNYDSPDYILINHGANDRGASAEEYLKDKV